MPQPATKLAILFADICGSSAIYDKYGDAIARQLIARYIDSMSNTIYQHQGTLIKTIGDEIMCSFPSAEAALHAACALQVAVEGDKLENYDPIHIRVGFHMGDVINEEGDLYGDTVNVAAHITAETRVCKIATTLAVFDELPKNLRAKMQQIYRSNLKGRSEQIDIYQVNWNEDDTSRTRIGIPAYRKPQEGNRALILRYRDQIFTVENQKKIAMLGREKSCSIAVNSDFASRQHAQLELRFGKFIITDQSVNGTHVRFGDGRMTSINSETLVLHGAGYISLGQTYADNPTELIQFAISTVVD